MFLFDIAIFGHNENHKSEMLASCYEIKKDFQMQRVPEL